MFDALLHSLAGSSLYDRMSSSHGEDAADDIAAQLSETMEEPGALLPVAAESVTPATTVAVEGDMGETPLFVPLSELIASGRETPLAALPEENSGSGMSTSDRSEQAGEGTHGAAVLTGDLSMENGTSAARESDPAMMDEHIPGESEVVANGTNGAKGEEVSLTADAPAADHATFADEQPSGEIHEAEALELTAAVEEPKGDRASARDEQAAQLSNRAEGERSAATEAIVEGDAAPDEGTHLDTDTVETNRHAAGTETNRHAAGTETNHASADGDSQHDSRNDSPRERSRPDRNGSETPEKVEASRTVNREPTPPREAVVEKRDDRGEPFRITSFDSRSAPGDATPSVQMTSSAPALSAPREAAGEAQLRGAHPEAWAARETMLDKLGSETRWLIRTGRNEAEIHLNPPELGKLTLRLTVTGKAVKGVIEVENAGVKAVLHSELPRLVASMNESGLDLSQFDVLLADRSKSEERDAFAPSENRNSAGSGDKYREENEEWKEEPAMARTTTGGTVVNYLY